MADVVLRESSVDGIFRPVEKVKERLRRTTSLLEAANIPYAVIGGNAVAAWVSRMDEGGMRNTPNVDFLIGREDFHRLTCTFKGPVSCGRSIVVFDASWRSLELDRVRPFE